MTGCSLRLAPVIKEDQNLHYYYYWIKYIRHHARLKEKEHLFRCRV